MYKYFSSLLKYSWFILGFVVFMIILSLITTFTNMSISVNNILIFIYTIINLFLIGFIRGRNCEKQGFLNGLLVGIIISIVFYLLGGIIFSFKLSFSKIIYYLVLILCSTLGAMLGINTKK